MTCRRAQDEHGGPDYCAPCSATISEWVPWEGHTVPISQLSAAATKAREWTKRRDQIISEAVRVGASLRDVAELAGLSHTAVSKIAKRAEGTP